MVAFAGNFEYHIDEKGRVPLPPKFRRALEDGLVLTRGPDANIVIYPAAEWQKVADRLSSAGSLEPLKMRRLKRAIFATAFPSELDAQGRVSVPQSLREYAAITSEVLVTGVNNYIELWEKSRGNEELTQSVEQEGQIIESLENRP
jgi:MraZ protein